MYYKTADEVLRQANCGLVSINAELEVCEGYDGPVDHRDEPEEGRLPPSERMKLADAMIERWKAYRDAATQAK